MNRAIIISSVVGGLVGVWAKRHWTSKMDGGSNVHLPGSDKPVNPMIPAVGLGIVVAFATYTVIK